MVFLNFNLDILFIHSFFILKNIYYITGIVLGAGDKKMNKKSSCLYVVHGMFVMRLCEPHSWLRRCSGEGETHFARESQGWHLHRYSQDEWVLVRRGVGGGDRKECWVITPPPVLPDGLGSVGTW